jgi:DNA mismatch repair protein MutH
MISRSDAVFLAGEIMRPLNAGKDRGYLAYLVEFEMGASASFQAPQHA